MSAILILDVPNKNEDLFYATHFWSEDSLLFIQHNGKKYFVLRNLEIGRGKKQATVNKILHYDRYSSLLRRKNGSRPITEADVIKAVLDDLKIKSIMVSASAQVGLIDALRKLKIKVTVAGETLFPERLIKNADEKKEMIRLQKIAMKGMRLVERILKESRIKKNKLIYKGKPLTSEIVQFEVNSFFLKFNCSANPIVAGGNQGVDPHDRGSGPLKPHEAIVVDLTPRSMTSGYFGDFTRTFCRGRASDKLKKQYDAVRQAQDIGFKMTRAGILGNKVYNAVCDFFKERGYKTGMQNGHMQGFFHGLGHGLGLDIHEFFRIGSVATPLKTGMVSSIEPGLYYKDIGGVRIEDVVYITPTGCEILGGNYPRKLEIL